MSAMMMAPMDTMVAYGAMMTDDARAMHGQHPVAASSSDKGGVDGGIIVIIGIAAAISSLIREASFEFRIGKTLGFDGQCLAATVLKTSQCKTGFPLRRC